MAFKAVRKPPVLAILLALFLIHTVNLALAASGGVMGGSSFSSDSSSSDMEDSWSSYSPPSSSCGSSCHHLSSEDTKVSTDDNQGFGLLDSIFISVIFGGFGWLVFDQFHRQRKSLLMLQVGLSAAARSIQKDLNQVAYTANTANVKGFHYILTETILALLRHPTHCISGYSFVEQKWNIEDLEKRFNQVSVEEREKFDTETLVNVNNIKEQRRCIPKSNKVGKDFLVVWSLINMKSDFGMTDRAT